MIILSQDKLKLYNFNNINCLIVMKDNNNDIYKIYSYDNTYRSSDNGDVLAVYGTEERAKEVLQEIIEEYEHTKHKWSYENLRIFKNEGRDFTYEMPEK